MEENPNFEEKEFENAINDEFFTLFSPGYSPGQVLENLIGFDRALFLPFWHFRWRRLFGIDRSLFLDELNDVLSGVDRNLPKFKVNLFLQYKRSVKVRPIIDGIKYYGDSDYFKYDIEAEQLKTLKHLDSIVNTRAAVYYCAPAFIERKSLFEYMSKKTVTKNSNFTGLKSLREDHTKITFAFPGFLSVGRSDPEDIKSDDFSEPARQREILFSKLFRDTVNDLYRFGLKRYALSENPEKQDFLREVEIALLVLSELNINWVIK